MSQFSASIQIESHQLAEYLVHAIADAVRQLSLNQSALTEISAKLDAVQKELSTRMAAIDDAIDSLTGQVTANTTVTGSAAVLIRGFAQLLADAIAAATAAGATPAQLAAVSALQAAIKTSDDDLAAAVAERTPAAPAVP